MLFGVVRREGHIVTPPFFPQGLRVNADTDAYVKALQTIVKPPWIDTVVNGKKTLYLRIHPIELPKPRFTISLGVHSAYIRKEE
ncbi:hypothetical protein ACTXT7_011397 [Hymenolepis weldensis]